MGPGRERGWTLARVTHLLDRYGDETPALLESIDSDDGAARRYGEPLERASAFLRAEVALNILPKVDCDTITQL